MTSSLSDTDLIHLRRCLELAAQAEGRTSPNPMVGAVVVDKNGVVVAEGFHMRAGEPHAEVNALRNLKGDASGGTIYVSLEPCCHHGKTPPCTDAVLKSGVRRVVAGCVDPNPVVAGQGMQKLADAGLEVIVADGALNNECLQLNRAFIKRVTTGMPWVCLKLAMTLDGRIADRNSKSRWISGPESRAKVHELRDKYDGVLVGTNTLLFDDPELNIREWNNLHRDFRHPVRVAVDSRLQLRADSRFCQTANAGRAVVYTAESLLTVDTQARYPATVKLRGMQNPRDLAEMLKLIVSEERLNSILCEGGGTLAAALLELGVVDEIFWVIAPKILLDGQAKPVMNGSQPRNLSESMKLHSREVFECGEDIWIHAFTSPMF